MLNVQNEWEEKIAKMGGRVADAGSGDIEYRRGGREREEEEEVVKGVY
jgi:hypothetical protein